MLQLIPKPFFKDPGLTWLDPVLEKVIFLWFCIKNYFFIYQRLLKIQKKDILTSLLR